MLAAISKVRAAFALAAALTLASAVPSHAIDARGLLQARAAATPPAGASNLCATYDWACARSATARVAFPADALKVLQQVNGFANRAIRPLSDVQQYAVAERWALPTRRGGDCEDYALFKKRALIEAGFPPERLLLASVLDRRMQPHAVLVVRMGPQDLVLDNITSRILPWEKTGYTFLRMQNPRSPDRWIALLTGGALS